MKDTDEKKPAGDSAGNRMADSPDGFFQEVKRMKMIGKACAVLTVCAVLLISVFSCASAETPGFGYVNAKDVAVRRGIGGKVIVRLPEDTCVWIRNARKDRSGVLWYEINAGLHVDYTNVDYTGWMKAEFIDAGDALWHDVESFSAAGCGVIALRKDGTVVAAGGWNSDSGSGSLRQWSGRLQGIAQVSVCDLGMEYCAVGQDGAWYTTGPGGSENSRNRIRLAGGRWWPFALTAENRLLMGQGSLRWILPEQVGAEELSHVTEIHDSFCRVLLLTDEGKLLVGSHLEDAANAPEPDWENWTDLAAVEASAALFEGGRGQYYSVYAGIRKDGTVLAAPEVLQRMIGDWRDMRKIVAAGTWVMGLKQDGTIVTAGNAAYPEVSGWTGITDIGAGTDYCVGLKQDGTLVFAGDHVFMGEGHSRK